jgi:sulfur-oxidizing protein SoxY
MGPYRLFSTLAAVMVVGAMAGPQAVGAGDDPWLEIRTQLFGDRQIDDASAFMRIDAPARAQEAALVPIDIVIDPQQLSDRTVRVITLVIDRNPVPVAARFHFHRPGNAAISTRVRVHEYTTIRAIAEMTDGSLQAASTFVKASGGCSAPALKTHDMADAQVGDMKVRQLESGRAGSPGRLQLLIRHPNHSGLQMDQIARTYIPARYVETIEITYERRPVLTVEGSISLSENPMVEFWFTPTQPGKLSVLAKDTDEAIFSRSWSVPGGL